MVSRAPIVDHDTAEGRVFEPAALLEGARRQKVSLSSAGLSVEMQAAALLAMSRALRRPVTCLAHVTNAMATRPDDFEKGEHGGQEEALELCARVLAAAVDHARSGSAEEGRRQP